jgi:tRNA pseudouridine55 synthase
METPFIHKEILPEKAYVIDKNLGETPLECIERFRSGMCTAGKSDFAKIPMTYAGRLDPMASGKLIVLCGDECKKKEEYFRVDKEYEVEILFGIETDTHDSLGLTETFGGKIDTSKIDSIDFKKYVGKFRQEYPAYSSKTVGGVQLHELSRKNELPEEMPAKEVEIYSIIEIKRSSIGAQELLKRILQNIDLVKGDFRQNEIKTRWKKALSSKEDVFSVVKVRAFCSSGTYMRSLASRIGKDIDVGAIALSIHRTKVGLY